MSDERPDSLAAQAASWVPPWERAPRGPDRAYQAAAEAAAEPDDEPDDEPADNLPAADGEACDDDVQGDDVQGDDVQGDDAQGGVGSGVGGPEMSAAEADADSGDALDEDERPVGGDVPPELAPFPGEGGGIATVDSPQELDEVPAAADPGPAPDSDEAADTGEAADRGKRARKRTATVPVQGGSGAGPSAAGGVAVERTGEDLDKAEPLEDGELRAALEAILLVVDEPVGELQLAQIVAEPAERVARMLEDVSARYTAAGHGFDLRRAAGGWRLYTRPEYAAYVERFVLDGQSVRLTQAALETLAVVAYKQPVTRSRISAIRGVNCDGVMRTLVTRGLIEECGTEGETGAYLYRTTVLFLEKLGLNSVDQLPPLAPFLPDDVEEVLDASG